MTPSTRRLRRFAVSVLAVGAAFTAPLAIAGAASDEPGPTQAEIEQADQLKRETFTAAESDYRGLLEEERGAGLCARALADGHDNRQCQVIVDDIAALDEGTYEPRFSPEGRE